MRDISIEDVYLSDEFLEDYANASPSAQRAIDNFVRKLASFKGFPKSCNLHRAKKPGPRMWIAWVTRSQAQWRALLEIEDNTVTILRYLTKKNMAKCLRHLQR